MINIGAIPSQVGRVAKIFTEGAESIGQNAARQRYATELADDTLRKAGATYEQYNAQFPDMVNQFAGAPAANTYQGLEGAAYKAGVMGGATADKVGGVVDAMGGPAGLAMNGLFMAPMIAPMVGSMFGGDDGQPTPDDIARMQQMQMRQQRGY